MSAARTLPLVAALALGALVAPASAHALALAQDASDPHAGHGAHGDEEPPRPEKVEDPHAAHAATTPDPHAGHAAPTPDPHAGHAMPASDPHAGHVTPTPDPHAGHVMPTPDPHAGHVTPTPDPNAGHVMPPPSPEPPTRAPGDEARVDHSAQGQDPHAGHAAPSDDPHAAHRDSPATSTPRTPVPVLTDADRAAAFPNVGGHAAHDRAMHSYWLFDKLEARREAGAGWEAEAWIGGDVNRFWIRTEGETHDGALEHASVELLGGRGVSAWWDVVAGVRHDWGDAPSQTFLAVGVQGLAPYKIELEATAYLGDGGQAGLRLEAGYETLLTPRWIVQWDLEAEAWGRDDARRGLGAGLSTLTAGARLRYEVNRRIAPYVGIEAERAFAGTADARRAAGDAVHDTRLVAGIRFWF
jgi:copper resistance protein B